MGWHVRRILRTGPVRWNLSRSGVGWSIGVPGLRYGVSALGHRYISIGLPGTGVYWTRYFGAQPHGLTPPLAGQPPSTQQAQSAAPPVVSSQPWWKQKP